MLVTLPRSSIFDISFRRNRIFSLVRGPIFKDISSGNGQGPEKPMVDEVVSEEEVFSFPYPGEKGEISDIVNPPVEGIAGEVLHTKSEAKENFNERSSDVLQYIFVNPIREAVIENAEPEFVSLTKQPEIAGSYVGLLVYSNYTASNANFSYTSDEAYESPSFNKKAVSYESDKPLYELKVQMPMISERFHYKEKDRVYVREAMQEKLQAYQNATQEEIKIQPVANPLVDVQYNNIPDSDSKLNLKLDYESSKLELPLLKTELPVLGLNIETNENEVGVLPLQEHSYDVNELIVPATISQTRFDTVNLPKYDPKAKVKYEAAKGVVTLPVNLGLDGALLRGKFIEKLNPQVIESGKHDIKLPQAEAVESRVLRETYANARDENRAKECKAIRDSVKLFDNANVKVGKVRIDLMEEPAFQYNANPLDFSLNSQPVVYDRMSIDLDPYALFNLGDTTLPSYQARIGLKDILLPNTEYRARTNLDILVKVNYDNGNVLFSPNITANSYNLDLVNVKLHTAPVGTSNYEGVSSEQNLEKVVEQERELTQEKPDENIEAQVYEDNAAQEEVYEKSEIEEEQETETNESEDSSVGYVAAAAGAVGLGVLAGVAGAVGALFKKKDDETISSNKTDKKLYEQEEEKAEEGCKDTSQCFADTIEWVEGGLRNPTLSDEEHEAISQCYAQDIKNIQKARDYIKQREIKKSCGGALYDRFHHLGFTEEQKEKYKLKDYVRDGETQQGFKLVTTVTVGDYIEGDYSIEAIWEDDLKGGELDQVKLRKNSAYAQLDMGLREQGYTPIWKMMSYIDTDTGEKRNDLYLETIAETHAEAKDLLGDKDDYGMKLMGTILLINGIEPGEGTMSMHDYDVKPDDIIELVFKNDLARYDDNQLTPDEEIEVGSGNYPKTKEEKLEPVLV